MALFVIVIRDFRWRVCRIEIIFNWKIKKKINTQNQRHFAIGEKLCANVKARNETMKAADC